MAQHQRTRRCDLRQTQQAATAFRRLVGGLAAEILRFDFSCVCVAQRCSARIAIHEAHRVLPDTRVLRGVFRALGIVPGYPSFVQFCAELILHLRFYPVKKFTKLFYVGSTEKSAMARERPLSQLCPLNSPCGTGHKRRTSELGFRSLSPKVLHQNFFEAASKPSFKRCSLRSIFLLFPGGFAFAKALLNLRMPPSLGKPASSDFGVKNGGSRCYNLLKPHFAACQLHCTPFSKSRHSEQKRPRGSSLLSWGATPCSISKQLSAFAALCALRWQNTCPRTWHPSH